MRLLPPNDDIGWTPFAWLIYLTPVAFTALADPRPLTIAITVPSLLAFLALYFRAYWVHGKTLLWTLVGIGALAAVTTPFNGGASAYFIFCGALFGMFFSRRLTAWAVLALLAILAVETVVFSLHPGAWIPAAVFTPLIAALNLHFSATSRANAKLRMAQQEVERLAKLDERERIARDLHDVLGHTLSVVTLKSELAGRLLAREVSDPEQHRQLREEIADIETLSRRAMREVRSSVRGYRAHRLQTELAKARMALVAAQIHLELEPGPYDLSSEQETVVAHALREAVTNVVRHSRALQCTIRLRTESDGGFLLEVEDDGRGVRSPPGSGLSGMKERVSAIGGQLAIAPAHQGSAGARGTRLVLRLPSARATSLQELSAAR